ncbi:MAG: hypothetical protein AAGE52_20310 [Myxococcota bacterium]
MDSGFDAGPTCEGRAPLPAALVGNFDVVGVGCSPLREPVPVEKFLTLTFGPCGEVLANNPITYAPSSFGALVPEGDHYLYREDSTDWDTPLDFEVVVGQPYGSSEVVRLLGEGWEAWAFRQQSRDAIPSGSLFDDEIDQRVFCFASESWEAFEWTTEVGRSIGEGDATSTTDPASLLLRNQQSNGWINRLATPWALEGYSLVGAVVAWDGREGVLRSPGGAAACLELDGEVAFQREGRDAMIVRADWLVLDVDDLDGDGDRSDAIVRRSEATYAESACD